MAAALPSKRVATQAREEMAMLTEMEQLEGRSSRIASPGFRAKAGLYSTEARASEILRHGIYYQEIVISLSPCRWKDVTFRLELGCQCFAGENGEVVLADPWLASCPFGYHSEELVWVS